MPIPAAVAAPEPVYEKIIDSPNKPPPGESVGKIRAKLVTPPAHADFAVRVWHADGTFTDEDVESVTNFGPLKNHPAGLVVLNIKEGSRRAKRIERQRLAEGQGQGRQPGQPA